MRVLRLILALGLAASPAGATRIKTTPVKPVTTNVGQVGAVGATALPQVSLTGGVGTLNGATLNGVTAQPSALPSAQAAAAPIAQPTMNQAVTPAAALGEQIVPAAAPPSRPMTPSERRLTGDDRAGDQTGDNTVPQAPKVGGAQQQAELEAVQERAGELKRGISAGTGLEDLVAGAAQFDGAGKRTGDVAGPAAGAQAFGRARPSGLVSRTQAALQGLAQPQAYASLPDFALHEEGDAARVLRDIERKQDAAGNKVVGSTWELYEDPPKRAPRLTENERWKANPGARDDGTGGIRAYLTRLTGLMRQALPGEEFELNDAHIRIAQAADPDGSMRLHIDGGNYMTLTLSYEGPGTNLFEIENGRVKTVPQPTGAAAIITNHDRVFKTGRQGTLHGVPRHASRRVTLIVRWRLPAHLEMTRAERDRTSALIDGQWRAALAQLEAQDAERAQARRRAQRRSEGGLANWVKSWFD